MTRHLRRCFRAALWIVSGLVAALAAVTVLTARPGDPALWPPPPGERAILVHLVSHGYHSGLVLPRDELAAVAGAHGHAALVAVAQRFAAYRDIEFGWGDEGFYRSVRSIASLTVGHALRALLLPGNAAVMHVVGLPEPPRRIFRSSTIVPIRLGEEGFGRLVAELEASFGRGAQQQPEELGAGLYGPSLFYRATGAFSLLNVCNHWVARLLAAAGLPTAPVVATMPQGMILDLRWRAVLRPAPHAAGVSDGS